MLRDRRRLARLVDRAAGLRDTAARDSALRQAGGELDASAARVAARRAAVPVISYPPELPVSQLKDEIAAVIRDNQVVIIAGETGSGKTTQLPKICLELGRGVTGQIGHTQPRRIAARTVAERIAAELGTELGGVVGYKVRFADTSSDATLVKIMTDGILLTELQRDRDMLRYDTLIIDEAHERSLNIDFILGYLRQLLPRRPDLKVIITSATIDPGRFSRHFPSGAQQSGAPVIEVSGRTYPVEVRYRPLAETAGPDGDPADQTQAVCDAVAELAAAGPGDILVFLSGEREIRDTADALAGQAGIEVVPFFARLPAAEQHRVFQPHQGRRGVLATNVAETSLTVPGIKYVIDPGTARISRYSQRTKVQRLPIEPVSQASANQRAGRCGRTSDGVCIRLYSQEDFDGRPPFTDPEILRTSLAAVILQMAALDLGEVADFPFVDPPDSRNVADGIRLLTELGAFAAEGGGTRRGGSPALTEVGRQLARLPVDPRLGAMIVAAGRNGCAREVLIITAALSIIDPRERPADARPAADALHARFAEPGSDFLAYLGLWEYLRDCQRELSSSAFRRMCRREYLHYLRVREWQDVCGQLRQAARDLGIAVEREPEPRPGSAVAAGPPAGPGTPAAAGTGPDGPDAAVRQLTAAVREPRFAPELANRVHMSLLAGLLSQLGMQETAARQRGKRRGPPEFAGAHGARFAIFHDSVIARKPPQWVMAAELVETSRLWARTAARIQPEWAEPLAAHLVKRSYSEPRWDAGRGAVMAAEKVTLYGLPIVAARQVSYGRIDPVAARDLFIRHALVEGDWLTRHQFLAANQRLLEEAGELERRARRRGLVADDSAVFDFYDKRIPAGVTSARHFDAWWKKARLADPHLLTFTPEHLAGPAAADVEPAEFPSSWGELPLSYEFAPGDPADGVSVDIPLPALNQVRAEELGWQVPGLRLELVTELIRSLPKQLRVLFVPAPQTAAAVAERLGSPHGNLPDVLAAELSRLGDVTVHRSDFDVSRLPAHLTITFRVTDGDRVLAAGKDLGALRLQLRPQLQATLAEASGGLTRTGLRAWDLDALPRVFTAGQVRAFPALADAGDSADIRLFETEAAARAAMWQGTRRLLLLAVPSGARAVAGRLPVSAKLAMSAHPYASAAGLLDDCAAAAADQVIEAAGGPAWDAAGFAHLLAAARTGLPAGTAGVISVVARVLAAAHAAAAEIDRASGTTSGTAAVVADVRGQLAGLIYPGFVADTGARRLPDLVRYLQAISRRLDKAPADPGRDAAQMAVVHRLTHACQQAADELAAPGRGGADTGADLGADTGAGLRAVRWMIEELRVSLFAQTLGTPVPVSERRIQAALDRLAD